MKKLLKVLATGLPLAVGLAVTGPAAAEQVKVGVALGGAMGLVYYALTEWPVRRSRALRRLRGR